MTVTKRQRALATLTGCASLVAFAGVADAASPLTRGQLAKRANAICAEAIGELRALPPVAPTSSRSQIRAMFDGGYLIEQRQLARLSALHPPAGLASVYKTNLVRHERFNQAIRALVVKLGTGTPVATVLAQGIPEITRRSDAFDRVAKSMGHTACTDPNRNASPAAISA